MTNSEYLDGARLKAKCDAELGIADTIFMLGDTPYCEVYRAYLEAYRADKKD